MDNYPIALRYCKNCTHEIDSQDLLHVETVTATKLILSLKIVLCLLAQTISQCIVHMTSHVRQEDSLR